MSAREKEEERGIMDQKRKWREGTYHDKELKNNPRQKNVEKTMQNR